MDAARTAKRLGVDEAIIIYRRDRSSMPAHDFEADEALEEGVKINWLRTIKEIDQSTFKVEVMELDENGRPQPTGEFESLEVDSLILAIGQDSDTGFLEKVPGIEFKTDQTVIVGENMMTGHPGIFAGGDMVPSDRSVTTNWSGMKNCSSGIARPRRRSNSNKYPLPSDKVASMRSCRTCRRRTRCSRQSDVYPAAIASSAMAVMAPARKARSSNWDQANAIDTTMSCVQAVRFAMNSALVMRST